MTIHSITLKSLRPAQIALGFKLVKAKRKGLRAHEKKPQELVDFILAHPIRVVAGPAKLFYIVDHHHLAHALLDEGYETAPVVVMADLSHLSTKQFWREMEAKSWLHPFDGKGHRESATAIPKKIIKMQDDPYRSLAGFVRRAGGFEKTDKPFAEFQWANYYRTKIPPKMLKRDFAAAVKRATKLAASPEASALPGYVKRPSSS